MSSLRGYDEWKLDAPEPSATQEWLDRLTLDDVLEIAIEEITQRWHRGDKWLTGLLMRHFEDMQENR